MDFTLGSKTNKNVPLGLNVFVFNPVVGTVYNFYPFLGSDPGDA